MDFGKKNRVRNYFVLKYKKDGMPFIKVGDIAGSWSVEYAYTHMMFAVLEKMVDDNAEGAMTALITSWYGACSIFDSNFTKSIFDEIDGFVKRRADVSESTEEEKEQIDVISEMEEHLENLGKES